MIQLIKLFNKIFTCFLNLLVVKDRCWPSKISASYRKRRWIKLLFITLHMLIFSRKSNWYRSPLIRVSNKASSLVYWLLALLSWRILMHNFIHRHMPFYSIWSSLWTAYIMELRWIPPDLLESLALSLLENSRKWTFRNNSLRGRVKVIWMDLLENANWWVHNFSRILRIRRAALSIK